MTTITEALGLARAQARVEARCRSGEARSARLGARMTLQDVGEVVGVTPSAVSRWESGNRLPKGETARMYDRLLNRLVRSAEKARA